MKISTGAVVTDPKEKADVFNHFFGGVFISDNGVCPEVEDRIRGDGLGPISFTPNLVRQVLKKLKPSISTGWDDIPNVFLSKCANNLAYPLCHIFNIYFLDGYLPDSWKYAIVTPIHKKDRHQILTIFVQYR